MFPHSTLSPLSLGELLDRAVSLYRRYCLKFVAIVAVVFIPITLLQILGTALAVVPILLAQYGDQRALPFVPLASLTSVAAQTGYAVLYVVLVQGIATAALTRAILHHYQGAPVAIVDTYRQIGRDLVQLLIALIIAYGVGVVIGLWLLVPCVGWMTGMGMSMFFQAAVVPLIAPIIVVEKRTALPALRRAWDLTRRRFWPMIWFSGALALFQQIITAGPVTLFVVLLISLLGLGGRENFALILAGQTVVQTLVLMASTLIFLPVQITATTLMYLDLRVRTEGLDLAWQAAVPTPPTVGAPPVMEVFSAAPAPEEGRLFQQVDWRNFVLITLGILGLIGVVLGLYFLLILVVMGGAAATR